MLPFTCDTACCTPLPPKRFPPSRSSTASCIPVDSARWSDGPAASPRTEDHLGFNRRIAAGIEDLSPNHVLNGAHNVTPSISALVGHRRSRLVGTPLKFAEATAMAPRPVGSGGRAPFRPASSVPPPGSIGPIPACGNLGARHAAAWPASHDHREASDVSSPQGNRRDQAVATGTIGFRPVDTPRASIIVTGWRSAPYLIDCLRSLEARIRSVPYEVIVSLNEPTPSLLGAIGRDVDGVGLLTSSVNRGFGGACNRGCAAARGDLLILLNDDAIVLDGWLESLVAAADQHEEAGAVGKPGSASRTATCKKKAP